jgi:hypothetical protein
MTKETAPAVRVPAGAGNRFDPANHSYWMGGVEVPGNTWTIQDNGFIDDEYFTAEGSIRGTRVHMLTQYLDEGDYDPEEARKYDLEGYVESWRKAKARWCFEVVLCEEVMFHKVFRFGTIVDRVLNWDAWETIAEIKTGAVEISHPYQTGAQSLACDSELGTYARGLRRRGAFYLKADGAEAQWEPHNDPADRNAFLAMLACTNLRIRHRLTLLPGQQHV